MVTAPSGPGPPNDAGTQGLIETQRLLGSIVVNAPIPIFFKDLDGVYLFVNDAYVAQWDDQPKHQIIGHTDAELYPESSAFREDDIAAVASGSPLRIVRPFTVGGEERIFDTVKFPILSRGGDVIGVCGIAIDITDTLHEQKDQEIERLRAIAAKPFERLFATLTDQEARVAELLSVGSSDKEIADTLSLAPDTVRHHVSHVLKKLRKQSRTQAVIEILRNRRRS